MRARRHDGCAEIAVEKQVDIVVEGHRRRQPQCNYASVTNGAQLDAHCKAVHEANSIARSDVMIGAPSAACVI